MKEHAAWSGTKMWILGGLLTLSLGLAAVLNLMVLEQSRPPAVRAAELSYLPKGVYLRVVVLGYRQVVADLIWLKAVQHFGAKYQTKEGYRWAYHAVDVLTDLDPKFSFAYQAAGTILGVWAGLPKESIALLEKGMRHNPEVWQLPFYIGYDYFYELDDPALAAAYFRKASELPGSPDYLPRSAARMTVESGEPEAALEFLQRLYPQVKDERVREGLVKRIKEVVVERDIQFLEEAVRRYQARYGSRPTTLEELVTGGIIYEVPEEPLGGTYLLHADGRVSSTEFKERLRVYRHR